MGRLPSGVMPEYTAQIVIMAKPELAGELRAWAEASGRHASDLQREVLIRGWELVKPELEESTPQRAKPTKTKVAEWVKRVDRSLRRDRLAATARRRQAVAKGAGSGTVSGA